jgi:proteic killer suppression protein
MIRTFRHKGLRQLFETGKSRAVAADLARRLIRQMDFLNRATQASDMNLPGYRLHELKGERKGTWSVTVSGNWRLTFSFRDGDAFEVDLEDYH